jgi:glycerol uptake facilitator-like aquaporin
LSDTPPNRYAKINMTRKLLAELLGTLLLVAVVVGSGIMGEQLAGGNDALALLGNTLATGAILVVLILIFGPISGAHFNPAVSLVFLLRGELSLLLMLAYVCVQILGGVGGTLLAHLMFELPLLEWSVTARTGVSQWLAEFVATFGLIATILGCLRARPDAIPYAVGLFITAGYWFTASTSFANPAVTIARSLTPTFSGINPAHVPGFVMAQLLAAVIAAWVLTWLFKPDVEQAAS